MSSDERRESNAPRHFRLALCALGARSEAWIKIVLPRAGGEGIVMQAVMGPDFGVCDAAIVDFDEPESLSAFWDLRQQNPRIPAIFVTEAGTDGFGPHRLARRTLIFRLPIVLAQLAGIRPTAPSPLATRPVELTGSDLAGLFAPTRSRALPQPLQTLVVDDSLAVRTQLVAALEALGFQVEGAGTAEEMKAFEPLSRFDIVFLDVVLPGRDGYLICRDLRADPQTDHLPIVMLTSRNAPFDRARGALAGCDLYLTKPVKPSEFHQAVEKALMKALKNDRAAALARGYKPPKSNPGRRVSAEG